MRWTQADPLDQLGDLREGNLYGYGTAPGSGHRTGGSRQNVWNDLDDVCGIAGFGDSAAAGAKKLASRPLNNTGLGHHRLRPARRRTRRHGR